MVEAARFIDGQLDHLLGTWSQAHCARHGLISTANNAFDGPASPLEINPQAREHIAGDAFPLPEQAKQEMLSADVVMVEALRLFLSKLHHMPGSLGEPVEASSLVRAYFVSLSARVGPAVASQPSADRANKMLRCHLLILSVSLLL